MQIRDIMKFLLSFLILTTFQGCMTDQSKVSLLIESNPSGAAVLQAGQHMGTTPLTLYYEVIPQFTSGYDMPLQTLEVKWVSGAFLKYDSVNLNKSQSFSQQIMFERPSKFPSLDIDLVAALASGESSSNQASYSAYYPQSETTNSGGRCAGSVFGAYNPCNPFSEYNLPNGTLNPDNPFSEVTSPFGALNPDNPFSEVTSPFGALNPDNPFSEVTSPFGALNPNNPFGAGTLQPVF